MSNIFQVRDKNGKKIRLTERQWKHINQEHPDISNYKVIREAIQKPTAIRKSKYDPEKVKWFYKLHKSKKRYLFVAVKYLNSKGFIITSYYTKAIK